MIARKKENCENHMMGNFDILILFLIFSGYFGVLYRRTFLFEKFLSELKEKYPKEFEKEGMPKLRGAGVFCGWTLEVNQETLSPTKLSFYVKDILEKYQNKIIFARKALWYERFFEQSTWWLSILVIFGVIALLWYVYDNAGHLR